MFLAQVQKFRTGTRYNLGILQLCGMKVKTKSQEVLRVKSHPQEVQFVKFCCVIIHFSFLQNNLISANLQNFLFPEVTAINSACN